MLLTSLTCGADRDCFDQRQNNRKVNANIIQSYWNLKLLKMPSLMRTSLTPRRPTEIQNKRVRLRLRELNYFDAKVFFRVLLELPSSINSKPKPLLVILIEPDQ